MILNNLKKVGLHNAKLVSTSPHLVIHSAMQRAYAYGSPPSIEESDQFTSESANNPDPSLREFADSPVNLSAARSILALTGLDHAVHLANTDTKLSPSGRIEKLAPIRTATVKTIAKAGADVASIGQAVHKSASEFYAPVKLAVNDAVSASEDRELRDHWKASPTPKRTVLLGEMQNGQHERLLQALTRSPVALEKHEASLVQACWLDNITKRDPKRAAEVQSKLDTHVWADSVVKASAHYARKSVGLSKLEMMDAAKGTGGEFMFADDNASITPTSAHVAA
jgi:hypothetical protein